MLIDNQEKLKEWIIRNVTSLSDAEPDVLAKYVVALLRKDIDHDELKKLCIIQLEVFLKTREFYRI